MNLLLIEADELREDGSVSLGDRRAEHLLRVLRVEAGDRVRVGVVGGGRGTARVAEADGAARAVELEVELETGSPARPDVDLVLGLPRPAVLHRVLQHAAAMGVGRLDLVNAWRVEKSYFQSPSLEAAAIRRHLLLGLEQGGRTWLPEVALRRLLVPFLEELEDPAEGELRLLAHPTATRRIEEVLEPAGPASGARRVRLAIGPEGGWIDRELETFSSRGFAAVSLGPWILRSEAALTAAMAQVDLLRRLRTPKVGGGAEPGVC